MQPCVPPALLLRLREVKAASSFTNPSERRSSCAAVAAQEVQAGSVTRAADDGPVPFPDRREGSTRKPRYLVAQTIASRSSGASVLERRSPPCEGHQPLAQGRRPGEGLVHLDPDQDALLRQFRPGAVSRAPSWRTQLPDNHQKRSFQEGAAAKTACAICGQDAPLSSSRKFVGDLEPHELFPGHRRAPHRPEQTGADSWRFRGPGTRRPDPRDGWGWDLERLHRPLGLPYPPCSSTSATRVESDVTFAASYLLELRCATRGGDDVVLVGTILRQKLPTSRCHCDGTRSTVPPGFPHLADLIAASRITNPTWREVVPDGETGLAGTDHHDRRTWRKFFDHPVTFGGIAETLKLNIIPLEHARRWQCAIHSPGLEHRRRASSVRPA